MKSIKTSEESNHSSEASGATPGGGGGGGPPPKNKTPREPRTHQNKAKPRKAGPLTENAAKASKRVPTLPSRLGGYCRVPKLEVPPTLLITAGKHPQTN
jgi:hypothetical protein